MLSRSFLGGFIWGFRRSASGCGVNLFCPRAHKLLTYVIKCTVQQCSSSDHNCDVHLARGRAVAPAHTGETWHINAIERTIMNAQTILVRHKYVAWHILNMKPYPQSDFPTHLQEVGDKKPFLITKLGQLKRWNNDIYKLGLWNHVAVMKTPFSPIGYFIDT